LTQTDFKKEPLQKIQKTPRRQLRTIRQNQPSSTKKPRAIVAPPQSARIMQRYIGSDSIRQIAREEQRDRATVTKIVRSDEMNAVVQKMRERYYGLGFDALDAVQHTLQVQKDGRPVVSFSLTSGWLCLQQKYVQSLVSRTKLR
jgi:hypothetical protein